MFGMFTQCPVSVALMALCLGVYVYVKRRGVSMETLAVSYRKVVADGEVWRVVSAAFTHLDLPHLIMNLWSLWAMASAEPLLGSTTFFKVTCILLALGEAFALGITHAMAYHMGLPQTEYQYCVGFSGVLFGWMTVLSQLTPQFTLAIPGGAGVPVTLAPFASLLITQLLVPRASFMAHFSGILAGFVVALGVFTWVTPYWFYTSLVYCVLGLLVNLRATTGLHIPGFDTTGDRAPCRSRPSGSANINNMAAVAVALAATSANDGAAAPGAGAGAGVGAGGGAAAGAGAAAANAVVGPGLGAVGVGAGAAVPRDAGASGAVGVADFLGAGGVAAPHGGVVLPQGSVSAV